MESHIPRDTFVQQGKSSPDTVHELVFAIQKQNMDQLEQLVVERSTPGNVLYQQWITFDDVTALTSNPEAANAVTDWLGREEGVTISWTSIRRDYIKASAKISVWEKLLQADFYEFEDISRQHIFKRSERVMHRCKTYYLPSVVKDHLSAVFNTVQTPPEYKPKYHRRDAVLSKTKNLRGAFRTDFVTKLIDNGADIHENTNKETQANGKVTVSFLNSLYEITGVGSGAYAQSVFETAEESFSPDDLTQFQSDYGLLQQTCEAPYGYDTTNCVTNDCDEGNLDVQYIMGVAQQTSTIYWYVGGNDPFTDWITDVANDPNPPLVNSMSWGSIEQGNSASSMTSFYNEAVSLAAVGVTVTVSSGDNGVASAAKYCNVQSGSSISSWTGSSTWTGEGYFPSFPATCPYVTAVGATMGPEDGDPEIACQSQLGGVITTGGGFSTYFAQPSWQTDVVNGYFANLTSGEQPTSGYNPLGRGYPDVSFIGVDYQVIVQGVTETLFGTSASSPVFAAMISLLNAARLANNQSSVGFLNPTLYAFGSNNTFGANGTDVKPFNDVTSGNNKCVVYSGGDPSQATCCNSGFYSTYGWDPVTGFGSLQYTQLDPMFGVSVNYTIPSSSSSSSSGSTLSEAAVIGIVFGTVVVVVGLIVFGIVSCCNTCCSTSSSSGARGGGGAAGANVVAAHAVYSAGAPTPTTQATTVQPGAGAGTGAGARAIPMSQFPATPPDTPSHSTQSTGALRAADLNGIAKNETTTSTQNPLMAASSSSGSS